jgi:hypothetical protein
MQTPNGLTLSTSRIPGRELSPPEPSLTSRSPCPTPGSRSLPVETIRNHPVVGRVRLTNRHHTAGQQGTTSARSRSTGRWPPRWQPTFNHGSWQDDVDDPQTPSQARAAAITELFAALDTLSRTYQSVPDDQRDERLASDADLITGEIARRLAVARATMSRPFLDPRPHRSIVR